MGKKFRIPSNQAYCLGINRHRSFRLREMMVPTVAAIHRFIGP
jgi:hypothetical protein